MKKILSFVLVTALVLSSFSMAFADTTTAVKKSTAKVASDVEGTSYEASVTVLTALGVVNGYEDGSYKPANNVTRAEMAKLIIAELGLEANAQSAKSSFKDMAGYSWADGYVGYAASLGIIKGYGNGNFGPANNVTHDEALTMIVRAIGYTSDCKEMNGTWPAIFVQKARVLGITDDVSLAGAVAANRGDIAVYLYNTLTCDMGYADSDGVFQKKLDKDGDTIKVATNLDVEESDKYSVITKSDADNSIANIRAYVGAYAKTFTLTKGDNDGDIIAISDVKSDFVTGEYKADDKVIETVDGVEYKLDDIASKGVVGTSKELDSKFTAYEFVNGDTGSKGSTILKTDQDTLDTDKGGTIVTIAADLSGKTIKGIYSVAMWHIDSDEQVEEDDVTSIKNNKTLLGKDFTLDDGDDSIDSTSFELMGVKSLNDIKVDDIVYVYTAGSDDEITRVAVGNQNVTGEVTGIKEDAKNAKVTINGTVYKFASQKLKQNGSTADFTDGDIDTEDNIKAFLDAYGYMFDYELASGGAQNYAIVLETGAGNNGIGSKHEVKLFLSDGTDKVFNTDDDLFKGSGVVPGVTTSTGINNGWEVTTGAIVKYGLDKDGVIDSFEKMDGSKDYQLVTTHATGDNNQSDITKKGYYASEEIRQEAVIFSFESTAGAITKDEDDYDVTTLEKVLDTEDVNATYVVYKNKIAAMLLFDYSGSDEVYGVVESAKKDTTVVGSDYSAKIFVDGKLTTYGLSSESIYTIAKNHVKATTTAGIDSVFKLSFNASGEVNGLKAAWTDPAPTGDTYSTFAAIVGTNEKATFQNNTFKLNNDSIKCQGDIKVYRSKDGDFEKGSTSDFSNLNSGAHVYFFDTEDDNNKGLMNIAYVYNPGKSVATSSSAVTTGTVTFINTSGTIEIDSVVYAIADTTVLRNELGVLEYNGKADIHGILSASATNRVFDVVSDSNKVISSLKYSAASTDKTAANATIALINEIPATTATDFAAKVTAADNSYTLLALGGGVVEVKQNLVPSAVLAKLTAAKKVITDGNAAAQAVSDANDFKTLPANATILAKTVDTVVITDDVDAVLAAYSVLSADAKALLTAEKTLLDNLKVKVDALKAVAAVATAKTNLAVGFTAPDTANSVTLALTLVATQDGATVTWVSSNTALVTNAGVVTQPNGADVQVTLTATITKGSATETKTFVVTVKGI